MQTKQQNFNFMTMFALIKLPNRLIFKKSYVRKSSLTLSMSYIKHVSLKNIYI